LRKPWTRLVAVAVFAAAFAVVEASVVYYLRRLFTLQYASVFTAQKFAFPHTYLRHEQVREGATIAMLLAVGYLAGRGWWQRFAYFLFAFGVWDIGYYVALKIMLDWPPSLATRDLLFLSPREWWAPVWEPVLASCAFIAVALLIVWRTKRA
jgi:hypothetical protein